MSEWIEFGKSWDELEAAEQLVGLEVEAFGGQRYLIGHVNAQGGYCDDCRDFNGHSIIDRYRRVWRPEPPK